MYERRNLSVELQAMMKKRFKATIYTNKSVQGVAFVGLQLIASERETHHSKKRRSKLISTQFTNRIKKEGKKVDGFGNGFELWSIQR